MTSLRSRRADKPAAQQSGTEEAVQQSDVTVLRPTAPLLADLAGYGEARTWGEDLARDIADALLRKIAWSDLDRGCLLVGPPGTGKTTFARALAATCKVPLIVTSYAEWLKSGDGHQGHVIQAMAATFGMAKKLAPCIVFVDEIDSMPARGHGAIHSNWNNQIVNAFLAETDGAASRDGVIVVGACNNAGNLDPALLRPGRFERVIDIPKPSVGDLEQILRFHLKADAIRMPGLKSLAVMCIGKTGADVAGIVRQARRLARRAGRALSHADVIAAITASTDPLPAEQEWRVAVHEAGHAICALRLGVARRVDLSLLAGHTQIDGGTRFAFLTPSSLLNLIAAILGGRAAEDILIGSVSAGAGGSEDSDLAKATEFAISAATRWGLSSEDALPIYARLPADQLIVSTSEIGSVARETLQDAYERALAVVSEHRKAIDMLARALVRHRAISFEDLVTLVRQEAALAATA